MRLEMEPEKVPFLNGRGHMDKKKQEPEQTTFGTFTIDQLVSEGAEAENVYTEKDETEG